MPDKIRQGIINELMHPSDTIFSDAENWALKDMCDNHWAEFKVCLFVGWCVGWLVGVLVGWCVTIIA